MNLERLISMSMTPKSDTLLYLDAVEEYLCFGWIDGVKKKISETELAQRLSPRSKGSSWTELNKERVRRLEKWGLMRGEGRKVLPDMNHDSFKIDEVIEQKLKRKSKYMRISWDFQLFIKEFGSTRYKVKISQNYLRAD